MRRRYSGDEIKEMVLRVQAGDERSLEELLKIFNPLIKRMANNVRKKLDLAISDSLHKAAMIRAAYAKTHNLEEVTTFLPPSLLFIDAHDNSYFKFDDLYTEFQFHFFWLVQRFDPCKMDFLGFIKKYMEQYERVHQHQAKEHRLCHER